jgi:phage baseplate assembly protein W
MAREHLGRGFAFPFLPGAAGRLALVGGEDRIRQSIWIILSTAPGERLMRPQFGCGIHDLVFEPNSAALRGVVAARVRDALTRWEPRIDLLDVQVGTDDAERNHLFISVDYRIRSNNAFYNLVYPFFVNEGVGFPADSGATGGTPSSGGAP